MLSLEQAAKFFIVAWVKNWNLRMLLDTLDGSVGEVTDARIDALVSAFTFMPKDLHCYITNHGCGLPVKQVVSSAFPKLNDALWNCSGDSARLALSAQVARIKTPDKLHHSRFSTLDRSEIANTRSKLRQTTTSYRASRDAFKSNQRSAWNVCK